MAEAGIIRRKLASGRAVTAEGGPGADRGWRIGLARAARDVLKVALEVRSLRVERRSLAELAELVPDRALIAVLEGPAEGLGAIILAQPVLSGFIEAQTIGRIRSQEAPSRKPTRTDAAMVIGVIDSALTGLEQSLAEEADLVWASGFRYASFLDDPRPLTLLLEDAPLRLLRAEVSLAGGLRVGEILLALPAEGRGQRPATSLAAAQPANHGPLFAEALADRLNGAQTKVEAVLARLTMSLAQVMQLTEGMVLPMPDATLNKISLEGLDGRRVGEGKLGQNRGMRAIRLSDRASGSGAGSLGVYEAEGEMEPSSVRISSAATHPFTASAPGRFPAINAQDLSDFLATGTD